MITGREWLCNCPPENPLTLTGVSQGNVGNIRVNTSEWAKRLSRAVCDGDGFGDGGFGRRLNLGDGEGDGSW